MEKTITLTLPDPLGSFIETQASKAGFAGPMDYIVNLLQGVQKHHLEEKVEKLLEEGLDSGFSPMTKEDWDCLRSKIPTGHHDQKN